MIREEWAVFPAFEPLPDGSCSCGDLSCERAGKHPEYPYSQLAKGEKVRGVEGRNYGVATGERSGCFVVDFDSLDAYEALAGKFPATFAVATARGVHLYFRWPGFHVKNSSGQLAPHVDVRGDGGFVLAPGSRHRSGATYEVVDDRDLVDAPPWLLEWPGLRGAVRALATPGVNAPRAIGPEHAEWDRRLTLAKERLASAPPAVQGAGGSAALWDVAIYLVRRLELPLDTCAELVEEIYNPRCEPAWSDVEIWHKLEDARDKSDLPCGIAPEGWALHAPAPDALAVRAPDAEPARPARRVHNPAHKYTHVPGHNAAADECRKVNLVDLVQALTTHPEWEGVLQWDDFRRRPLAVDPPLRMDLETSGLTNEDVTGVRTWFEAGGVAVGHEECARAIEAACKVSRFHPVREYLASLPPGDPAILDELPRAALGVEDPLEFLKKTLVAAVRRVLRPGCQVDTVLVLQGRQGEKKSSFVAALFGDEFTRSQLPSIETKDASAALQGFWAIELAEIDRILRSDPETVRDFITRRFDDYRPSYGRADLRFPRQCVFIGTVNPKDFLRDPEGNRRYLVLSCEHKADLDWVHVHRDAIWAAARDLAATDYRHWFDDEATVDATRAEFVQTDPWHEVVEEYCAGRVWVGTTTDVYMHAVAKGEQGALSRFDMKAKARVVASLRRLGCESATKWVNGRNIRGWRVPAGLAERRPGESEEARRAVAELREKVTRN